MFINGLERNEQSL